MANLLPKQIKTKLLWGKRVRITFVLMIVSIIGLALAVAALLPIVIYSKIVLAGTSNNVGIAKAQSFGKQRQELIRELKSDKELLENTSTIATLPSSDNILSEVSNTIKNINGAELRLITLEAHIEKGSYTVRASGIAFERDTVMAVRKAFEASKDLTIIDFPLGNITPRGDEYNFTIELAAKNKNNKTK